MPGPNSIVAPTTNATVRSGATSTGGRPGRFTRQTMAEWSAANRRGSRGEHHYSLSDYGVSTGEVAEAPAPKAEAARVEAPEPASPRGGRRSGRHAPMAPRRLGPRYLGGPDQRRQGSTHPRRCRYPRHHVHDHERRVAGCCRRPPGRNERVHDGQAEGRRRHGRDRSGWR